jgi:hydroxyacylglutathione hydrolase
MTKNAAAGGGMEISLCKRKSFALLVICLLAFLPLLGQNDNSLEEAWKKLKSANPHFSNGMKAFEERRNGDASSEFLKCIEEMPRHAYARYYLANLFYIGGDYQRASIHMELALDHFDFMRELIDYGDGLKKKNIDAYENMLEAEARIPHNCRTSRRIESVAGQLSDERSGMEIIAKRRQDMQARQKAHYLYFSGNIDFQLKRFPEALRRYQEAIALNPDHASAYSNAAAICYMAKDYPAAAAYLERAERQGLEDNVNLKLKHLVYGALGRPTEGILREDVSHGGEGGLEVVRLALAFKSEDANLPPLYENCYIAYDGRSKQAVIIDPGVRDSRIDDFVRERGLEVKAILNTHGHRDHTAADGYYSDLLGAPVYAPRADSEILDDPPNGFLEGGKSPGFGGIMVSVIHTPGHTPGSLCFLIGDFLFSGDTLFRNDIGNVWPEDEKDAGKIRETLIRNIREKLLTLPGPTRICPGHGRTSTIADEIAGNPFLKK